MADGGRRVRSLRAMDAETRAAIQRRTMAVLAVSVALATAGAAAAFSASAVLAKDLTGSDALGGLAAACLTLGTAATAIPLARIMSRSGRRPGLRAGLAVAAAGALAAMLAVVVESYVVLVGGMLAIGAGAAAALAARFAAADLADPAKRARAIGLVVWASTFGAVLGPTIGLGGAGLIANAIGGSRIAGVYLFAAACFGLAALVIERQLRPDPLIVAGAGRTAADLAVESSLRRGVAAIRSSPGARLGVMAMILGHVVMVGVMTVTPLHMADGGQSLTVIGLVISFHILGMYAFSPVVGWLVDRVGPHLPIAIGGGFLVVGAEMAARTDSHERAPIFLALFLIGIGWCFELVAGSSLLTGSVAAAQRVTAQGVADLAMNALGAAAGIGAGITIALRDFGALGHGAAFAALAVLLAGAVALIGNRRPAELGPPA